ncbi:hypothetical protein [Edaphobacter aggregans]|uniref:hypothetical protein n=1 Tax=Edaphobacter aggregans TaxID=570835 RepID=UPI000556214E|nr:hypothetical protein [Edaphobacter aggregans]
MIPDLVRTKTAKAGAFIAAAFIAIVLPVVGCNSKTKPTPANFTQVLNSYFLEHPECLFSGVRFPYATSDPDMTKQLNTLVKSKMLESSYESSVHTTRYTVAPAGSRYAPRFCYGHRTISTIDSFTPPAKGATGFPETHVAYHYTIQDTPVWAKSPDVLAAFPEMASALANGGSGQATLAQTLAGWQVPE